MMGLKYHHLLSLWFPFVGESTPRIPMRRCNESNRRTMKSKREEVPTEEETQKVSRPHCSERSKLSLFQQSKGSWSHRSVFRKARNMLLWLRAVSLSTFSRTRATRPLRCSSAPMFTRRRSRIRPLIYGDPGRRAGSLRGSRLARAGFSSISFFSHRKSSSSNVNAQGMAADRKDNHATN